MLGGESLISHEVKCIQGRKSKEKKGGLVKHGKSKLGRDWKHFSIKGGPIKSVQQNFWGSNSDQETCGQKLRKRRRLGAVGQRDSPELLTGDRGTKDHCPGTE